ncbi:hypothetical protein KFE25_006655 [Diacronema lutheri]|uniref:NIF system FeS cluster assembly NifU C-terminal domain-containing protein n=1 Tax=Diacronema lutheri TaxID=2081491 RepID=A0A8J6CHC5_DIALT|nr:hypothetical protein KFE25_006655 [Diacronema lutheri]
MSSTRPSGAPGARGAYEADDDDDDDDDEAFVPPAERVRRAQDGAGAVISPFANAASTPAPPAAAAPSALLALTAENVDAALDEVRPALLADGGNIEVVEVDASSGVVKLALQGACTTCPSASITMQQGVESTLRRVFPQISSVVAVPPRAADAGAASDPAELTIEAVQEVVTQILPAITGMGGTLRLVSASADGRVEVQFTGPARVQYGVDLALRDNKLVKEVVFSAPK